MYQSDRGLLKRRELKLGYIYSDRERERETESREAEEDRDRDEADEVYVCVEEGRRVGRGWETK